MAGQPKLYGHYVPVLNGSILAETSEMSWGNENSDTDVITLMNGWSGATVGQDKMMISVTIHDPVVGSIVDLLQEKEFSREVVDFQVLQLGGGLSAKAKGFIRNVKGSSSVGSNSAITFEFHGTPASFE